LAGKLAAAPSPPPTFADVARLDDAALATVLHTAETEIMILALAGSTAELVERVLAQLPLEEGKALCYALDHLGPTRLSDVEEAQHELARLARRLQQSGQLPRAKDRGLSLAV
jgi:flagellar motor switch protein FliG